MKTKLFIVLMSVLALTGHASAVSLKVYGALAQADLSGMPPAASTFNYQFCTIASGASPVCSLTPLSWTRIADDGGGNVQNPGDGTMNAQGWLLADQYIQISNVQVNDPGWVLDIFTDNTDWQNSHANPRFDLTGTPGPVNGLVSSDKQFVVPLSWKLTTTPVTNFNDTQQWPNWDEDALGTGCHSPKAGFCDFATHYMSDLLDTDPLLPASANLTWWQYIADPSQKFTAAQYQSPLSSLGLAVGDFYRTPYSTTGNGIYQIYLAAKFAPGTIRDVYQTTIFLEMTHL